ncbi:MAG: nitroreductase family protein, partial [Endomicrobium sp.]|jgi:nitroreductase|nr:nitroreductase family protein [Endomicrobium sp.]
MILTAPLAILVLGDSNLAYEGYLPQDCAASTQNILLAATAKGYGSVWCGIYSNTSREKAISMLFKLPNNIKPFSLVVIGKKSDISENKVDVIEKKQYLTNKVKYETWN